MKRLSIVSSLVLAVTIYAWGQDSIYVAGYGWVHPMGFSEHPQIIIQPTQASSLEDITLSAVLSLWDGYKKECYNDSTSKIGWILRFDGGKEYFVEFTNGDYGFSGELMTKWIHRTPNIEGFMEYLKKIKGVKK
jgi:hypothetical protein